MATQMKISQLPAIPQTPANADVLAIEVNGTTYKVSKQAMAAAIAANIAPADISAFGAGSLPSSVTDISSATLYGQRMVSSDNVTDLPSVSGSKYFSLICMGSLQIAAHYGGSNGVQEVFVRQYTNSTWYPWTRIDAVGNTSIAESGVYSFGSIEAGAAASTDITFAKALSNNSYMVLTETLTASITTGAQSKTATGFKLFVRNVGAAASTASIRWAVVMLN